MFFMKKSMFYEKAIAKKKNSRNFEFCILKNENN